MVEVINFGDLPPEDKAAALKHSLHQARTNLLNAQIIVGVQSEQYKEIDELIAVLEEMIMRKQTPRD